MAKGLVIGAPRSGSGKTVITLGLLAALRRRGTVVAPAKTGPDYIDPAFLSRAALRDAVNLDPWSMSPARLKALAAMQATGADLLLVEGVMGLFDGAADNTGSTADLAELLELPVILVVDAERQSQSVAPLVAGFANWRPGVRVAGVILNRVASTKHERMLVDAVAATGIACLGAIPRDSHLVVPERHLGLVLPGEVSAFETFIDTSAETIGNYVDLEKLLSLATPIAEGDAPPSPLAPLGQRIAIARDDAFAFLYPHLLDGWRAMGAELSFFSPLADEAPSADCTAVFLPGGYPELHGAKLAAASAFKAGLIAARDRDALIYGECGGFMVLGETLVDKAGQGHAMAGLLPVTTRIDRPKRILGYRRLLQAGDLPWPGRLHGHEFHYSSARQSRLAPLFAAADARGEVLPPMGAVIGRVMGSYAHVVDAA
ncbi:hydrogenobyrinic acid a,c-diamide synthase (glutamine-hydrolysing) /cobyrinate a,c-diamide synthase [Devosia sp. YR412]|uniref:cobyrinate a,c-diamide synthase n=1 Tax=Devosia sp. YR412 TaxID=1881030 RepID=UPI0008BE6916|nr:cobyrinate a,c-diamide synthase [Devosia sp. YR412]SEP85212.1 hydrogenobyrinic acid a,c-diamide synthase (glutamine-hydrolysing) /cobyrinate a,c-diamide synthase [Devosia sp. YR412]